MSFETIRSKGKAIMRDTDAGTRYIFIGRNRLHRWYLHYIKHVPKEDIWGDFKRASYPIDIDLERCMPISEESSD